jgi:hypothetical protein
VRPATEHELRSNSVMQICLKETRQQTTAVPTAVLFRCGRDGCTLPITSVLTGCDHASSRSCILNTSGVKSNSEAAETIARQAAVQALQQVFLLSVQVPVLYRAWQVALVASMLAADACEGGR